MQKDHRLPGNEPNNKAWINTENCDVFDIDRLMQRLSGLATKHGLSIQNLGDIGDYPLLLLTPAHLNQGPNLLVAAGFHGDEPAGCWGIVRFLDSTKPTSLMNLSFLPLVNPTGFRQHKRTNMWHEDPNRGFLHRNLIVQTSTANSPPSREGQVLLKHLSWLMSLASQGFLSLHEDMEYSKGYLYTFEKLGVPGLFSQTLRNQVARYFDLFPDGQLEGGFVQNGIIFGFHDGSFEDFLFHNGIRLTASTETPGLADINKRVEANSSLIAALGNFALAQSI